MSVTTTTDPTVGPMLMLGLGGKYVEVLRDVVLPAHRITNVDALETVAAGGRAGRAGVVLPVVHDALLRLSALVADFPQVAEIDLNPVLLSPNPEDCRIVDVRIRMKKEA